MHTSGFDFFLSSNPTSVDWCKNLRNLDRDVIIHIAIDYGVDLSAQKLEVPLGIDNKFR
jgi:hypothetical protein